MGPTCLPIWCMLPRRSANWDFYSNQFKLVNPRVSRQISLGFYKYFAFVVLELSFCASTTIIWGLLWLETHDFSMSHARCSLSRSTGNSDQPLLLTVYVNVNGELPLSSRL